MRQIFESLLGVVNTLDNSPSEFFEKVGKSVLFRGGIASFGAGFGFSGNVTVGIESAKGSIAFFEYTAGFFDERSDFVNECFLVAFLLRSAFTGLDRLSDEVSIRANKAWVACDRLTSLICLQIGCTRSRVS